MLNLAVLDPVAGTPVAGFSAPALGGPIYAVRSDGTNLYAGGHFPGNFAKVNPSMGALVWRGNSGATIYGLLPMAGTLYVGGFNGAWRVDPLTGVRDTRFAPKFTVA